MEYHNLDLRSSWVQLFLVLAVTHPVPGNSYAQPPALSILLDRSNNQKLSSLYLHLGIFPSLAPLTSYGARENRSKPSWVCQDNHHMNNFSCLPSFLQNKYLSVCAHAKLLQSCLTICDLMDCSLPGSSVHEILQARVLEWVSLPFSRGSSQPRDQTEVFYVSCIKGGGE